MLILESETSAPGVCLQGGGTSSHTSQVESERYGYGHGCTRSQKRYERILLPLSCKFSLFCQETEVETERKLSRCVYVFLQPNLDFRIPFYTKRNQDSLEKQWIQAWWMSVQNKPEIFCCARMWRNMKRITGICQKDIRANSKWFLLDKSRVFWVLK